MSGGVARNARLCAHALAVQAARRLVSSAQSDVGAHALARNIYAIAPLNPGTVMGHSISGDPPHFCGGSITESG